MTMRRLLLFDVDGTLLRGGPAKVAFGRALDEVFGLRAGAEDVDFSGKTDPQIVREVMERSGVPRRRVEELLPRVWSRYLAELEERIQGDPPERLPGVVELLAELEEAGEAALGLVTGNLAGGARLKLEAVGLAHHFPVGAYGSDHEERDHLPGIAAERAARHWGRPFRPDSVVVVGDTPRDIRCARVHGARSVAVATGRFSFDALAAEAPDHLLEDLRETRRVVEALAAAGPVDPPGGDTG